MSDIVEPTLQEQFDELVKRKLELWDAIKDDELFRETDEWREIEQIDAALWDIKHKMEGE